MGSGAGRAAGVGCAKRRQRRHTIRWGDVCCVQIRWGAHVTNGLFKIAAPIPRRLCRHLATVTDSPRRLATDRRAEVTAPRAAFPLAPAGPHGLSPLFTFGAEGSHIAHSKRERKREGGERTGGEEDGMEFFEGKRARELRGSFAYALDATLEPQTPQVQIPTPKLQIAFLQNGGKHRSSRRESPTPVYPSPPPSPPVQPSSTSSTPPRP